MDYFHKIDNAGRAYLVQQYKNNLLKRKLTFLDIWFNNECLRSQVIPNYVSLRTRTKTSSSFKALRVASRTWIKEELKKHYFTLNLLDLKLKKIYFKITSLLHPVEWDSLVSKFLDCVEDIGKAKFERLSNKLYHLTLKQHKHFNNHNNFNNISLFNHNSTVNVFNSTAHNASFYNEVFLNELDVTSMLNGHFSDFNFHKRVLNLSSTTLDACEESLLCLGLNYNFNFTPSPSDLQLLAVETEKILENSNLSQQQHMIRSQVSVTLNKFYTSPQQTAHSAIKINKDLSKLRQRISDMDLVLSKADKGNCIVVMDRQCYIQKVEDFLDPVDFKASIQNPTSTFFIYLKKILSVTNDTLNFLNSDKSRLYPMNPQTPLLYGLPKIHKEGTPIRPVVSYSNSPAYKLASWLNNIIISSTKFSSKYSIKNSFELTNKLKNISFPEQSFLVSFDVKNLFPSVPPEDCIELVRNLLFRESNIPTHHILNICLLVDTVLRQNFCQFNNKFYSQISGLAMGSPLSPLLAEIFLSNLESKIETHPLFSKIVCFFRYVDDTFVIFNGSSQELQILLTFLNSLNSSIQFTMELEVDGSIPFLDLLIQRRQNKLDFGIYHKPTSTDLVIPYHSNHPHSHKIAAFNSYFHRLFNLPLSHTNFTIELNHIRQIAVNNNYPLYFINRLYYKHLSRSLNKKIITPSTDLKPKYHSLTFFNGISYKIQDIFRKLNINIIFKTQSKLKKFVVHTKDKIPLMDKSGVYRISCGHQGCNVCYVGQSGRKITTRVNEHQKIIEKHVNHTDINSKSTFANHIINEKHSFDLGTCTKVLHVCDKGVTLNLLEIMEIQRALKDPNLSCINDQISFSCLSFFNSLNFLNS